MQDKASISTKKNIEQCLWKTDEFDEPNMKDLKIDSEVAADNDKEVFLEILRTGEVKKGQKSPYAANYRFLTDNNDYPEIFKSFFDDFILYDCRFSQETIQDVPGRNSAAHSLYDKYPTKKAALNAIMFTNFLIPMKQSSLRNYGTASSAGENVL